jgi:hypothetical protein
MRWTKDGMPRKKAIRRESPFCTDIVNELKLHHFAFKIPDQIFNPMARFNPKKAVDIVSCLDGRFVAVEAKMLKVKTIKVQSLFNELREDQITCLNSIVEAKGFAFVVGKKYIPRNSEYYLVRWGNPESMLNKFFSVKDLVFGIRLLVCAGLSAEKDKPIELLEA